MNEKLPMSINDPFLSMSRIDADRWHRFHLVQEDIEEFKTEFRGWENIPGKLRTSFADRMRSAGFTYIPDRGWEPLFNSTSLDTNF